MKLGQDYPKIVEYPYGMLSNNIQLYVDEPCHNASEWNNNFSALLRQLLRDHPINVCCEDRVVITENIRIPIRIYRPLQSENEILPIMYFIHGGGWEKGDLETHDYECRSICAGVPCVVVAIDYRVTPTFKFPAGLEDCYRILLWIHDHAASFGGDPTKICIGGDSAGGNYSVAVCMLAHERSGPAITRQILIYPALDMSDTDHGSYVMYCGDNPVGQDTIRVQKEACEFLFHQYVNDPVELLLPLVSPLLAEDVSYMPPATFILGQCDVLLDEGLRYAKRLGDCGIDVSWHVFDGMPHAFLQYNYPQSFEARQVIIDELREAFANEVY